MRNYRKINLEFVSETIEIDKENGRTKCTLTFRPHFREFAEFYGRPCDKLLGEGTKKFMGLKKALTTDIFTVSGVSVCSKDDTFNKELGVVLARNRARAKAEKKYNNWLKVYLKFAEEALVRMYKAYERSNQALHDYKMNEEVFQRVF